MFNKGRGKQKVEKNVFLTFDVDWAIDSVLDDFYKLIKELEVKATVNITHQTKFIEVFRQDKDIELGIHPNYNILLANDGEGVCHKNVSEVLTFTKNLVPEAVTVRSHALTDSSIIVEQYDKFGIKYDLNKLIPPQDNMRIYPYGALTGHSLVLPFIFEDDIYLGMEKKTDIEYYFSDKFEAPRILNFHPIHLFINTPSLSYYKQIKKYYKNYSKLIENVNRKEFGVRDIFKEMIDKAREYGYTFKTISEGEWE